MGGFGRAKIALTVAQLGQHFARNVKTIEQPIVPLSRPDVVKHGAGGVARLHGVESAPGQLEQEKTVDRAETHLAVPRACVEARDIGKQPSELRRRKIGIDDKARRFGDMAVETFLAELIAKLRGAPILPNDGVEQRLGRSPLPYERGLTLIGDPDCPDRLRADVAQRAASRCKHRLPDLLGIVLDFARRRIDLGQGHLRRGERAPLNTEGNRARAGCALVDGEHDTAPAHGDAVFPVWPKIQPQ
jgi:hypothetical protein